MKARSIESMKSNTGFGDARRRLKLILYCLSSLFALALIKDFYLQVIASSTLSAKAANQFQRAIEIKPRRGAIFDRNRCSLAESIEVNSVFAIPRGISDARKTASVLARVLTLNESEVIKKLSVNKAFVWIKRLISDDEYKKLCELNLEGVGFIEENKRIYPQDSLGGQMLGFTGIDNEGLEGVERQFEKHIAGLSGIKVITEHDARGKSPFVYEKPVTDGDNIVLTLDKNIQHIVQTELAKGVIEANAKGGTAIVIDPSNGDIIAIANYPEFNPNERKSYKPSAWRNKAISDFFEPGSLFKVVMASAALENKIVSPYTMIDCSPGYITVGNRRIKDAHPHGVLSFKEVIGKSSNVGSIKVSLKMGKDLLYKYIKLYGFGDKTGVGLQGESSGMLRDPSKWSGVSIGSITIGQEIAVTPLQLTMAYAVIANGGVLYKPRLLKRIEGWDGTLKDSFEPVPVRRVMSKETAFTLRDILKTVVEDGGTATLAGIDGFTVAGKTGTAQKAGNGGYLSGKFFSSFVGFLPADNPKIVISVIIDEPVGAYYGGVVAAPIFRSIAERSMLYLGVKPDVETDKPLLAEENNKEASEPPKIKKVNASSPVVKVSPPNKRKS
ncbi:MAG: penicillin-binding protein 2 [Candidatus Schekmanbacteria bacterium]|nr:penicillin-binding protein 2 [Candidatus Schekmanbacteria bacterium]